MGVAESLRRAVGHFGSGSHDEFDEDERYDLDDDRPEERDHGHTLVLVRPACRNFFLAVPHVFDDVQDIAAHLKADTSVIVDLHDCSGGLLERVVDFCGGLVYALDGGFYRIGDRVLLLSPSTVDLSSELGPEIFRHSIFAHS